MDLKNRPVAQYLQFLKDDIHFTVFSTVDEQGQPESRIIDIMLVKDNKLYFFPRPRSHFIDNY